jgi:hypothetical protein
MTATAIAPGTWVKFTEPTGVAQPGDFGVVASWSIRAGGEFIVADPPPPDFQPVVLLAERSLRDGTAYWQPARQDVLIPIDEIPSINVEEYADYVAQIGLEAALRQLKRVAARKVKS